MRRRQLIGTAALTALSPLCWASSPMDHFQLIIVGAGAAGLTCACIAAENGVKNILVLEKNPVIGGSSLIARGTWFASGTASQTSRGVQDSDHDAVLYLKSEGLGKNDETLLEAMLPAGREQMAWFEHNDIRPVAFFAEKGVRRIHKFDMPEVIFFLRKKALSLGVKIWTGCPVKDLIQDEVTGRIKGVVFTRAGADRKAFASLGVVLCSGGFSRDKSLLGSVQEGLQNVATIAPPGLTGDGLKMGIRVGAATADLEHIKASYAFTDNPSSYQDMTFAYYYGPVIVNDDCARFVSESAPYKEIARKVIQQHEAKSYLVFDDEIRKTVSRLANASGPLKEFWGTGKIGNLPVFSGKTVDEVAQNAHIDPVGLKDTVDMYNEAITKLGKDPDFYRKDLTGKARLAPIVKPPFYVIPVKPALLGTYGGLKINEDAQVLNKSGKPIPGLWAAGEVTGGVHGAAAAMGVPLASAFGFGRIAGLSAAKALREARK